MIDSINTFFNDHQELAKQIINLVEQYKLADFVCVTKSLKAFVEEKNVENAGIIYGCLLNIRDNSLRLTIESVEYRLNVDYFDLLIELMKAQDDINRVYYIVAFHYLSFCKQIGFELTGRNTSPFRLFGTELTPSAKNNMEELHKAYNDDRIGCIPWLQESDVLFFRMIYDNFGYHHHATKHFSLLSEIVNAPSCINQYELDSAFKDVLDLFIFRYKAAFTTEQMSAYMTLDDRKQIIKQLVDLDI